MCVTLLIPMALPKAAVEAARAAVLTVHQAAGLLTSSAPRLPAVQEALRLLRAAEGLSRAAVATLVCPRGDHGVGQQQSGQRPPKEKMDGKKEVSEKEQGQGISRSAKRRRRRRLAAADSSAAGGGGGPLPAAAAPQVLGLGGSEFVGDFSELWGDAGMECDGGVTAQSSSGVPTAATSSGVEGDQVLSSLRAYLQQGKLPMVRHLAHQMGLDSTGSKAVVIERIVTKRAQKGKEVI